MDKQTEIEMLQKKVSYLEKYTDDLNEVVLELRKEIKRLHIRIDTIELNSQEHETIRDIEKPPHY